MRGSWEGFVTSPLYIYNNGSWGGVQTTGITATTQKTKAVVTDVSHDGQVTPVINVKTTGITELERYNFVLARLNSSVNLTNYNYLNVDILAQNNVLTYIGVASVPNITSAGGLQVKYSSRTNGVYKLNISSLSGHYFIYFGAQGEQSTKRIADIWIGSVFLSAS